MKRHRRFNSEADIEVHKGIMSQNHKITFIYLLWLFIAWAFYIEFIYQRLTPYAVYGEIFSEIMRFVIFIAPLFLVFKKIEFPGFTDLGFHGNFIKNISIGIIASIIFIAISAPLTMILKGKDIGIENLSVAPMWVALTCAVVIEEVVFRGYMLNSFLDYGRSMAVLISSIFFLLIHYPGWWILETHPSLASWITTSAGIFILGIVLGLLFLRFNSLWVCILVHSANNLVAATIR
jgi:membrane protease YdiL (CAAX protease family)